MRFELGLESALGRIRTCAHGPGRYCDRASFPWSEDCRGSVGRCRRSVGAGSRRSRRSGCSALLGLTPTLSAYASGNTHHLDDRRVHSCRSAYPADFPSTFGRSGVTFQVTTLRGSDAGAYYVDA